MSYELSKRLYVGIQVKKKNSKTNGLNYEIPVKIPENLNGKFVELITINCPGMFNFIS